MKKSDPRSTYLLVESICCHNGNMPFLAYHQKRLVKSMEAHFPGLPPHDLYRIFQNEQFPDRLVKVRFLYNGHSFAIEKIPYARKAVRSLQVVKDDQIEYPYKYTDRTKLEALYDRRKEADEVLIVKNDLLTDAFYANIVCIIEGKLFTPSTPLLKGVMREYLLDKNIIQARDIPVSLLRKVKGIFLINALNPISTAAFIPPSGIHF